jgi:hypothetical protein
MVLALFVFGMSKNLSKPKYYVNKNLVKLKLFVMDKPGGQIG